MPFGLNITPEHFWRALYIVLELYKCKKCLVYLENNIVFSKDEKSHLQHVDQILIALDLANVTTNLRKFELLIQKFRSLGHIIEPGRLIIDDFIFKALEEACKPLTKQDVASFLGLCNIYRIFFCG